MVLLFLILIFNFVMTSSSRAILLHLADTKIAVYGLW